MSARKILALTAAVPLVAGVVAADAAPKKKPAPKPKPVCNLVKDPTGDAKGLPFGGDNGPNDPNLDIISADVATDATRLTAVIRLASLGGQGDTSPAGRAYSFVFVAKGSTETIEGIVGPSGTTWAGSKGTGTVDKAKNEIRIHVPLSTLDAKIKPNDKLTDLKATSWRWVHGTRVVLGNVDTAITTATYTAGWPSCVKVGA